MPILTLPDGSTRTYDRPVTAAEVARDIGPGLAKAALAARVDGALVDLARVIDKDASLAIVTAKSPEALEVLRHDVAHLMAEAVKELYPETQVTIGPAIENGFYYDFARPQPFTPDDLARIEARMHEIVARDETITREEWKRDDAVEFFSEQGRNIRPRSSRAFRRASRSASIARATSSTCAAAPICPRPARSARLSS
jgi:threonyl-tRNA synthetase